MLSVFTMKSQWAPLHLKSPASGLLAAWWRHQMETFSALLAICAGNSPVPGEFLAHRPVTRSFDVYFDLSPNKRLSKQLWGWWFETQSRPLWRHCNGAVCLGGHQSKHQSSNALAFVLLPSQRASNAENVSIWWRNHVAIILSRSHYVTMTPDTGGRPDNKLNA